MNKDPIIIITTFLLIIAVGCRSQYKVYNVRQQQTNITIYAQYTGTDQYYGNNKNPISTHIVFMLQAHTYFDFYFSIKDINNTRYQIPIGGVFHTDPNAKNTFPIQFASFAFNYTADPFDFRIYRKYSNSTIFSTYDGDLIFSQHYLQIVSQVQSDYTFGLGQRFNPGLKLKTGKWTIFSRGRGQVIDDGQGQQTYGYYPFYLQKQDLQHCHSVYIRSSNAMDVIKQEKNNKYYLTYKIIGGILNFRFIMGDDSCNKQIDRMISYIGRPILPPFWSLGFHQSRFGYDNITVIENVIKGYQTNNIPLDTIWLDIDYMNQYEDFTIDQKRFPLQKLRSILQKYKIVPIIDAGISINSNAYNQGKKRKVFLMDAKGKQYIGSVWPGETTFVDFFHPNASQYWLDMLQLFFNKVNFSGIWLDMNQLTQFCNGPCQPPTSQSQFDYSKDLPYNPGFDNIQSFTVSLNSTHYGNLLQADVHIYHSLLQSSATYNFLNKKTGLPFILTRSSTFGSNKFSFMWSGDNYADFSFLKSSISDMIISQMTGMTMSGADICGFGGNTTVQLCSRWLQLGSLYPFARNHNTLRAKSQQPYVLGQIVLKAAQNNIKLRYSLLSHYYSILIKGTPLILPQFIQFQTPNDFSQFVLDTQFLIGKSLIATPIVESGLNRQIYLPKTNWYDFHTGRFYTPGFYNITNISLTDKVPLFLRENNIILTQHVENVQNTRDLNNRFKIVCGFKYEAELQIDGGYSYFSAQGDRASISNFSNQTRVKQCVNSHCIYQFYTYLSIYRKNSKKVIQLNISTYTPTTLLQLIVIDQITAYANGTIANIKLNDPIQIRGIGQYFVELIQTQIPNQYIGMKRQKKHLTKE